MIFKNLAFKIALITVFITQYTLAALPVNKDISWTAQGGIKVNNWLTAEEDYGLIVSPTTGLPMENKILKQTDNTIEYINDVVKINK